MNTCSFTIENTETKFFYMLMGRILSSELQLIIYIYSKMVQ